MISFGQVVLGIIILAAIFTLVPVWSYLMVKEIGRGWFAAKREYVEKTIKEGVFNGKE
mgnify:CR=1 FL=1